MTPPTLNDILAQPHRLQGLTREELCALFMSAQSIAALCVLRMLDPPAPAETGATLDTRQAAARLGIAPGTLANRARRAPYLALLVQNGTRRLAFSAAAVEAFKAGSAPGVPAGAGAGKRPRQPAQFPPWLQPRRGEQHP
jgi:hypothetical protein